MNNFYISVGVTFIQWKERYFKNNSKTAIDNTEIVRF